MADPADLGERTQLGLRALWSGTVLDVTPPRRHLRFLLRRPLRKKRV